MKKRSVNIMGHQTSISLEEEYWSELKAIAKTQGKSLNQLVAEIDKKRAQSNLSSALRVYILQYFKNRLTAE